MDISLNLDKSVQIIIQTVGISAFTHNSILCIYHIYRTLQFHKTKGNISVIEIFSVFALISAVYSNIVSIFSSFGIHPTFISCKLFTDLVSISYFFFKFLSYFLFLERLYRVFNDTEYAFRLSTVYISRLLLILFFIGVCTLIFITGTGYKTDNISNKFYCLPRYPSLIYILVAFYDIFIVILISIIFTRNIMLLGISSIDISHHTLPYPIQKSESTKTKVKNKKIQKKLSPKKLTSHYFGLDVIRRDPIAWMAVNKFTLLTFISIFSTFFTLIFCAIFGLSLLWMTIDTIINSVTIMLMFVVHRKIYNTLCLKIQNIAVSLQCLTCYSCHCCYQIKSPFTPQNRIQLPSASPVAFDNNAETVMGTIMTTLDEEKIKNTEKDDFQLNIPRLKLQITTTHSIVLRQKCGELFDDIIPDHGQQPSKIQMTLPTKNHKSDLTESCSQIDVDKVLEGVFEDPNTLKIPGIQLEKSRSSQVDKILHAVGVIKY